MISNPPTNSAEVASGALFAEIAALWESRPEYLARVTEQVRVIYGKLIEWGFDSEEADDLDHATIAFSKVVQSYECCEWLPFDLVPSWETDLYCILMDEERWAKYREVGRCTSKLAARIKKANDKGLAVADPDPKASNEDEN